MELVQIVPGEARRKKSRWVHSALDPKSVNRFSKSSHKVFSPPTFVDLPQGLSQEEIDQFFREQRLDDLTRKLRGNNLEMGDPDIREPSPAPVYDPNGIRTNPREVRVKRQMEEEYARLNRFLLKRIPGYSPPADLYKTTKIVKKIQIPTESFPGINFMAIIVGPRGVNHRYLQDESKCRIEFRGMDSSSHNQSFEEAEMPLHVHIEGSTDDDVELAVSLVKPLLDPSSAEFQQARSGASDTMARISGSTIRCTLCQAVGHSAASCPDNIGSVTNEIRCSVCGGKGHLTVDCPQGSSSAVLEVYSIPGSSPASHLPKPKADLPPVMIPSNIIGTFIGVQGANIKRLMVDSGCNIQVDQSKLSQGVTSCPLVFTGPAEAAIRARTLCEEWLVTAEKQREERNRLYHHERAMTGAGGFTDPEAAAQAVQMAYYQQMMWQAWAAQYGQPPPQ